MHISISTEAQTHLGLLVSLADKLRDTAVIQLGAKVQLNTPLLDKDQPDILSLEVPILVDQVIGDAEDGLGLEKRV
jgi:hypothetical protein